MARKETLDRAEKADLLRDLAFQSRRKHPLDAALQEYFDEQFARGRRREFRAAAECLTEQGAAAALTALDLYGEEAGLVMAVLLESGDHRQIAAALTALSDYCRNGED